MSFSSTKFFVAVCAALAIAAVVQRADLSLTATLPKDMPSDAKFSATGFDPNNNEARGQWVACREHAADGTDWCRVTNQWGVVIYQGDFLPVGRSTPVPAGQLRIGNFSPARDWVRGPSESENVPVIPLESGILLAPADDNQALPARWALDPEELQRVLAN